VRAARTPLVYDFFSGILTVTGFFVHQVRGANILSRDTPPGGSDGSLPASPLCHFLISHCPRRVPGGRQAERQVVVLN